MVVGGVLLSLLVGLSHNSCAQSLSLFDPRGVSLLLLHNISHHRLASFSCYFRTDENFFFVLPFLVIKWGWEKVWFQNLWDVGTKRIVRWFFFINV